MAATTTVNVTGLNVPQLVDNAYWFVNAAAWNSYWKNAEFTITFGVADTVDYGLVKAANTVAYVPSAPIAPVEYVVQTTDALGNPQTINIFSAEYVASLAAQLAALDANFQQWKAASVAAGQCNN